MSAWVPLSYRHQDDAFGRGISVVARGLETWVVTNGVEVLNGDMEWEYEPMPSNRSEEFIARTRFYLDKALDLANQKRREGAA